MFGKLLVVGSVDTVYHPVQHVFLLFIVQGNVFSLANFICQVVHQCWGQGQKLKHVILQSSLDESNDGIMKVSTFWALLHSRTTNRLHLNSLDLLCGHTRAVIHASGNVALLFAIKSSSWRACRQSEWCPFAGSRPKSASVPSPSCARPQR